MPTPTNTTPARATVITGLPYTTTVVAADLDLTPTGSGYASTCDTTQFKALWWSVTTSAIDTVISVSTDQTNPGGSPNYTPTLSIWSGAISSLTQYQVGSQAFCGTQLGSYFEIPISPSTTYYLQVTDQSNAAAGADLSLTVVRLVAAPAPIGSVVIPDDTNSFPAVLFSAASGTFLQLRSEIPAGEFGDTMPTGELCVQNGSSATGVIVLDSDLSTIATISYAPKIVVGIKSDKTSNFYIILTQSGTYTVKTVSKTGSQGGTTWTLPSAATVAAVNRAGTRFYFGIRNNADSSIHVYDLTNSTPLSDLAASVSMESLAGSGDGFVTSSNQIVFAYVTQGASTGGKIRKYNTSGSVLQTVTTGDELNHYAPDPDDLSWWAWLYSTGGQPPYTFKRFLLSNGSTATTLANLDGMTTSGEPNTGAFGISNSCPILLLSAALPAPTAPVPAGTTRVQRRLRRFALPFETNLWMFLSRLEIEMQSGQGLTTGQGSNPVLMCRISRDGGITYGNVLQMGTGALGQYTFRAYLNRLGRGRNFVVEITDTDPVFSALLDCYIDYEQGTS